MVSHLQFPTGLPGGLLLAYPRMKKAEALWLRRRNLMPRCLRDFFALVHARA